MSTTTFDNMWFLLPPLLIWNKACARPHNNTSGRSTTGNCRRDSESGVGRASSPCNKTHVRNPHALPDIELLVFSSCDAVISSLRVERSKTRLQQRRALLAAVLSSDLPAAQLQKCKSTDPKRQQHDHGRSDGVDFEGLFVRVGADAAA